MSAAKHTPGPWRCLQRGTQVWGRSVGGSRLVESDHLIGDVRGWGHIQYLPNGEGVQDANGRLIAAAPDMLEALEKLARLGNGDEYGNSDGNMIARAAIAKATGGEL